MTIDVFCDSENHPILPFLKEWVDDRSGANLFCKKSDLKGGHFLFLISCNQIISREIRDLYKHTFVIHASDLPKGRGWSPLIWQILEGKSEVMVSLIKAEDRVDSGGIYKKEVLKFSGTEIYDEINYKLFQITFNLMTWAVENVNNDFKVQYQVNEQASHYRKRIPIDSELNINSSIKKQINLLRVCDPKRYPAFFYYKGCKYEVEIKPIKNQ